MPEITVVIPTRDRSALLRRTVRCALRQRDVDLQVVVVDDASRDDTAAAIAGLGDPRVTLVRNARPEGVSAARNRGIGLAAAEWIALLDDDDLWAPSKLASQLREARRLSRCWACAGSVTVDDALRIVAGRPPLSDEAMLRQLPRRNVVPAGASNVIARRSAIVAAGGFDRQLRHIADWDLWIRLGRLGPPAVVCEPLVAYQLHATNASADAGSIAAELSRVEARHRERPHALRVDRAFAYRWAAWHYLIAGRPARAIRAYAHAIAVGDITSLARLVVALLHPGIARQPLARHRPDPAWEARAAPWLHELASV
ncbi:MAG TPA: glycosyltransferase family A protein [Gemmatimonadaceae bacterium]